MLNLNQGYPIIRNDFAIGIRCNGKKYYFKKSNNKESNNIVNNVRYCNRDWPIKCLNILSLIFKRKISKFLVNDTVYYVKEK